MIGAPSVKYVHAGQLRHQFADRRCRRARRCPSRRSRPARPCRAGAGRRRARCTRSALARMPTRQRAATPWPATAGSGSARLSPMAACTPSAAAWRLDQVHRRVAEGARHADRLRPVEDLGRRAVLQQFAGIHHGGVAAEQQRLGRLGGGVDHGGVAAGEQRATAPRAALRAACSPGSPAARRAASAAPSWPARAPARRAAAARRTARPAGASGTARCAAWRPVRAHARLDRRPRRAPRSRSGEAMLSATVIDG